MATKAPDLQRTVELMARLSEPSLRIVRDLVALLADREDLDEGLDEEERQLFARVAGGDLSGTVTLEEATRLVLGSEGEPQSCSR